MRGLLLILGTALACGLQAVDVPQRVAELDLEKVAGTWHTVAMAANDPSLLEPESAPLRVFIKEARPMPEGSLELTLSRQENNECIEKTILMEKTQDPAQFRIDSPDGDKVFVLDADSTSYLFLCVESAAGPTQNLACQALARTLQADPEVMKKFKLVLKALPLQVRLFLDLTEGRGECTQAPGPPLPGSMGG
ncbi:glycodelin [Choloepus didactylus]|uniref:glycodelin n=1 Tax=Choloepus didactylus TaxID=27675 RepID=UPI00189F48CC|nr:glycodelin [Choloepus didactylus]